MTPKSLSLFDDVNAAPAPMAATVQAAVDAELSAAPPAPLDYFADTPHHLSGSDLRAGLLNADDALWKRLHPSSTKYTDAGNAIHLALLEGHKFDELVAIKPEGLRRGTKVGDAWYEENADKYAVSQDIHDRAILYVGGYQPALEDITDGQLDYFEQVNERPIYWTDPVAGLCRCKPDTLLRGPKCISVSVKTTAKPVNTELWTYQLISGSRSAGYDIAEYHYARGIADHHLGSPERWAEVEVWHVVATTAGAPRLLAIRVSPDIIARAHDIWQRHAPGIAAAIRRTAVPLVLDLRTAELPKWANYSTPDDAPDTEEEA
jgi:hypothetical protein